MMLYTILQTRWITTMSKDIDIFFVRLLKLIILRYGGIKITREGPRKKVVAKRGGQRSTEKRKEKEKRKRKAKEQKRERKEKREMRKKEKRKEMRKDKSEIIYLFACCSSD